MYEWRKLNAKERAALISERIQKNYPLHRPPHFYNVSGSYHIVCSCYEHAHIIGLSPRRMLDFTHSLLTTLASLHVDISAWCVLPNHYHILVRIDNLKRFMVGLGRFHGRTSFIWNGEENCRGRKVWHSAADRFIRSEAHFWATLNYIHHNPVHHGYVEKWADWPYSSVHEFLETVGKEKATEIWRRFPPREYGRGWDDPAL